MDNDKLKPFKYGDVVSISKKIKDDIYKPVFSLKTTVFLCGADINLESMMRFKVAEILKDYYFIDLKYPEHIFEELLFNATTNNLLYLENLLARSVDVIVMIPESPGSFAELGAFASNEFLSKKMVCLLDEKYKKVKSFINQGPIRQVRQHSEVGLVHFNPNNLVKLGKDLIHAVKKIKKESSKEHDDITLLEVKDFLLPTIYLLEPVSKDVLECIVKEATNQSNDSQTATITALSNLIKDKLVQITAEGDYKLSPAGFNSFFNYQKIDVRSNNPEEVLKMDDLRLEIFNLRYRNKKMQL